MRYPVTPDGRYLVVRGRLWRMSNPALADDRREELVRQRMAARRAVGIAKRAGDREGEGAARAELDRTKTALGERGPVWWEDGAPDLNRAMVSSANYADWYHGLTTESGTGQT